jgi:hypothetical protein
LKSKIDEKKKKTKKEGKLYLIPLIYATICNVSPNLPINTIGVAMGSVRI